MFAQFQERYKDAASQRNGAIIVRAARAVAIDKAAGLPEGQLRCVISTDTPDRCNDVMSPKGVDAKAFLNNPTVLWMHDAYRPSIGKCVAGSLKVSGHGIEATVQFDMKDEFAADIYRKYQEGFLSAFSIGFIPSEWEDDKEGVRTYTKYELLEFSCVTTPMNSEALATEVGKAATDATGEAVQNTPSADTTPNADDALAARIDATEAAAKALAGAVIDFADPEAITEYLKGMAQTAQSLNEILTKLTTTPITHMDNITTATVIEVVEKAGAELNADNKKTLKALHDDMAACHKAFGKVKEGMKAFLVGKGVEIKDDPDGDGDNDSQNAEKDPFDSDDKKAILDEMNTMKAVIGNIPILIREGIAAAKQAEVDAEAARIEAEKKAADEAELARKAEIEEYMKSRGL